LPIDLPGGKTIVSNIHQIQKIDQSSSECDDNSVAESHSDTKDYLSWNGDSDDPNDDKLD
jgi:hypothetical protein